MKKILTVVLCFGLFLHIPSTVKPISTKVHIGSSIAAAIATGLLTGSITYLIMNESEKKDEQYYSSLGDPQGLEEQQKQKDSTNKILIPLGAGLLGACIGGGATYWILYPYTGKAKVEKAGLLLDAVDKNGLFDTRQDVDAAFGNIGNDGNHQVIDGFIRANSDLSPTPFPTVQKKIDSLKTEIKNVEVLMREAKKDDPRVNTQEADGRIARYKDRIAQLENFILVNRRDQFEEQCVEHNKRKELNEHGKSYWENKENKEDKNRVHDREDRKTTSDCNLKDGKGTFMRGLGNNNQTQVQVEVGVKV